MVYFHCLKNKGRRAKEKTERVRAERDKNHQQGGKLKDQRNKVAKYTQRINKKSKEISKQELQTKDITKYKISKLFSVNLNIFVITIYFNKQNR